MVDQSLAFYQVGGINETLQRCESTTNNVDRRKLLTDRDKVRGLGLHLVEGADHAVSFNMPTLPTPLQRDDVLLFGLRVNMKILADFIIVGDQLSTEPYAIMLRKDDAPFKHLVGKEMSRIVLEGELQKLYMKWFNHPIPPKGVNLNMPMGFLLRDSLAFPTDKVAD
jgi:glutamate/aspartate transport system substrate-binding protein